MPARIRAIRRFRRTIKQEPFDAHLEAGLFSDFSRNARLWTLSVIPAATREDPHRRAVAKCAAKEEDGVIADDGRLVPSMAECYHDT